MNSSIMFSMTPDEVRAKYGRLSERRFFTMVDEKAGRAMVLEDCCARGPAEWDLMNIKRAGGVVEDVKLRDYEIGRASCRERV